MRSPRQRDGAGGRPGVTAGGRLERRYRRLLGWYPAGYRAAFGEEMLGVLMAADGGGRRPGLAGTLDLILGGLRARFRAARRRLADIDWPDSLAVCSIAVPGLLVGYELANWLTFTPGLPMPAHLWAGRGLVVLAIAAPPALALRYRRTGALVTLAIAGWLSVFLAGQLAGTWNWIGSGDLISGALALVLTAAATAFSAGPRRGLAVLTWKSWLVLTGAAVSIGVLQHYLWQLPTWLAALIVAADLTLIAAGLPGDDPRAGGTRHAGAARRSRISGGGLRGRDQRLLHHVPRRFPERGVPAHHRARRPGSGRGVAARPQAAVHMT